MIIVCEKCKKPANIVGKLLRTRHEKNFYMVHRCKGCRPKPRASVQSKKKVIKCVVQNSMKEML